MCWLQCWSLQLAYRLVHSLVFVFQGDDRIRAEIARSKGLTMIYRERRPLEREAEQESVGWSTAAPARTEIDALKASLNDPSCGWIV